MKKKEIINLIQYHYNNDETQFRNTVNNIAVEFDKNGDHQLAEYIMASTSSANVFVPQSFDFENKFVKEVQIQNSSLPLSQPIADDITGIINAVNHNIGINKFLFQGSPGTGKTESAKQVARLLKRSLYVVDFNQLIDSKMGQTAKNIAIVFNEINTMPSSLGSIILFDEIDSIALDRINENDIREMGRATSSILRELDNVNPQVVIIATTNLYSKLDKALKRRFDSVINFDRYSNEDLIEISEAMLNVYLKKFKEAGRDMKLFKKIFNTAANIPKPGDLKNIIKTSLAFSDPQKPLDYLSRIYREIHNVLKIDIVNLKKEGFTIREISVLIGQSKSTVGRAFKELENE